MPRWDNADPDLTQAIVDALGDVPGPEDEIDVCAGCHRPHLGEVEHAPYDEMVWYCAVCDKLLGAEDD